MDGEDRIITAGSSEQYKGDAREAGSIDHKYDSSHRVLENTRTQTWGKGEWYKEKEGNRSVTCHPLALSASLSGLQHWAGFQSAAIQSQDWDEPCATDVAIDTQLSSCHGCTSRDCISSNP